MKVSGLAGDGAVGVVATGRTGRRPAATRPARTGPPCSPSAGAAPRRRSGPGRSRGLRASSSARCGAPPEPRSSDRAIRTVPASRSTSDHRSATSSPRRAPVSAASATAVASHRIFGLGGLEELVSRSGVGTTISLRSTAGGVARSVGAAVDPSPLHRLTAGRAQDRVVLVHRRRREALRRAIRGRPGRALSASSLLELDVPELRPDPRLDLAPVLVERARALSSTLGASSHCRAAGRPSPCSGRTCPPRPRSRASPVPYRRLLSVPMNVASTWRGLPVTGRRRRTRAAANVRGAVRASFRCLVSCVVGGHGHASLTPLGHLVGLISGQIPRYWPLTWWALRDSNPRPQPCEGCALTS